MSSQRALPGTSVRYTTVCSGSPGPRWLVKTQCTMLPAQQDLVQGLTQELAQDLTQDLARDLAQDLARDLARALAQVLTQDLAQDLYSVTLLLFKAAHSRKWTLMTRGPVSAPSHSISGTAVRPSNLGPRHPRTLRCKHMKLARRCGMPDSSTTGLQELDTVQRGTGQSTGVSRADRRIHASQRGMK